MPPTDRLFLALFPTIPVADRIAAIAKRLTEQHGLSALPLPAQRLHVTLFHFGDYRGGIPEATVRMASAASSALAFRPFKIVFDRIGSFKRASANKPLVLRGGGSALMDFHGALGDKFGNILIRRKRPSSFTPHVTMLYAPILVAEQSIEPISWTATEFVLVHSLLGRTRHIPLARWRLDG